ncbi:hypothetical protein B296_00005863 [Ensete ventricosum]|uniref:Glycosyl transferase family 1 domain-containing protein n=1 Tax=Ensete ventricosum TaxID=4639 RepID=A0A427A6V9_ENSVE|nr:hypothetical protein B296_00005863 [Ensete ventricosum]
MIPADSLLRTNHLRSPALTSSPPTRLLSFHYAPASSPSLRFWSSSFPRELRIALRRGRRKTGAYAEMSKKMVTEEVKEEEEEETPPMTLVDQEDSCKPRRIALFVEPSPFAPELEKMFSGMPVVFTGMLQGVELSQAYASGDVFMMPSESETLGLVVLEAMSSGVPVVAARAGGIPDIIPEEQEGKTSFLFTPGNLDDCVSKIEQLLSCREFREAMGKAAREEMEKCDWRAATQKIRNEQYNAAIWFWRKKRAQLLGPIQRLVRRFFKSPQINYG